MISVPELPELFLTLSEQEYASAALRCVRPYYKGPKGVGITFHVK